MAVRSGERGGRNTMPELTVEQEACRTLSPYLDRLLDSYADELNESTRKRKAFLVFLFGGISGLAVERGLTPEQAQAVAISLFFEELAIPPMDGLRVVEFGVEATAGETPWSYAAQAGVDEFFLWRADPAGYATSRLRSVLDRAPDIDQSEPMS
jgi:hypothetical protein